MVIDKLLYGTPAIANPSKIYILTATDCIKIENKERMIKKWIKAIFIKPFTILKSIWFNITEKHENLAEERLEICNHCDKKINIKYVGDVCDICGCILDNKTRIEDEHCDLCKW